MTACPKCHFSRVPSLFSSSLTSVSLVPQSFHLKFFCADLILEFALQITRLLGQWSPGPSSLTLSLIWSNSPFSIYFSPTLGLLPWKSGLAVKFVAMISPLVSWGAKMRSAGRIRRTGPALRRRGGPGPCTPPSGPDKITGITSSPLHPLFTP